MLGVLGTVHDALTVVFPRPPSANQHPHGLDWGHALTHTRPAEGRVRTL
jgi:hypothetical protein